MKFRIIGAAVLTLIVPALASAGVIRFSTAGCGGFSSCNDAAFVAGAGVPLTFNDLLFPVDGPVAGTVYSADFTLSSTASATFSGGITSPLVTHANTTTSSSEVGPAGTNFNGIVNIALTNPVSAIGFGTVEIGDQIGEVIRLFNGSTLLGSFSPIGASTFNYEGFVASGGDAITNVQIEGGHFAIQNIKYGGSVSPTAVPEPATLLLLGSGLVVSARRRLKKRA
jgi:hypothetical protein